MKITLRIWRQQHRDDPGRMVTYHLDDISPEQPGGWASYVAGVL